MEDYEFILEGGEVKLVTNGVTHNIGKAYILDKNFIYVHPTEDEIAKGIVAFRHELTDEDVTEIQELLEES